MHRLQVLWAYLFHRCAFYTDSMLQDVLIIVRPPTLKPSSSDVIDAQKSFQDLLDVISKMHMRLTTHFLESTQYGRKHWEDLNRSRSNKTRRPILEAENIANALDLPAIALRAVWFPLTVVVMPGSWDPMPCSDGEALSDSNAQSDTPALAQFRRLTGEIILRMVKTWSKNHREMSTHVQIAIFKELTNLLATTEWPPFNPQGKHLAYFRKGIYAPERVFTFIDNGIKSNFIFLDKALQSRAEQPEEMGEDADSQSVQPTNVDSTQTTADDTPNDCDVEMGNTDDPYSEADGAPDHATDSETDAKADEDNDTVVGSASDEALPSTKVVGRPIFFGSEFTETGGAGLPLKSMNDVFDNNEQNRSHIVEVLEDTAEMLLGAQYIADEGEAISAMSARSHAMYAKLRLERENRVINDAIWRVQKIVDDNKAEIAELDFRIAEEEEKRKYLDRLDSEMKSSYTTIQERHDTLDGFSGTKCDSDDDKKASWRDRARNVKQGKVGVQWKYTPKDAGGKGKDIERPHHPSSQATQMKSQATPMKPQATPMKPPAITPDIKHIATPTASTSFTGDCSATASVDEGSDMGDASQPTAAVAYEM
jgi:hypothetical protein